MNMYAKKTCAALKSNMKIERNNESSEASTCIKNNKSIRC